MGAAFGKRLVVAGPATGGVTRILVSQSTHASKDATAIVAEVVDFVNAMMHQGYYLRNELPISALRVFHTDYYLAQVANGGHSQFVLNSRWDPIVIQDITDGLKAMHALPYTSIFADLRKLIESDKRRTRAIAEGRAFDENDAAIKALDDRFFAQDPYAAFSPIIAGFLRKLPELEVVPDQEYRARVQQLAEANPQRMVRLAGREREAMIGNLVNPLRVAAQLLCMRGDCLPLQAIGGGDPTAVAPDGREGTGWHLQTGDGHKVMFVFNDLAYLCETHLPDGRKLTNELMSEINAKVAAGEVNVLTAFSKMMQHEVANVPVREIASAIEAAKAQPIGTIAALLCQKLGTGEQMRDIFACGLQQSGEWMWMVATERRAAVFEVSGGDIVLHDLEMQPIASVSADEVREAVAGAVAGRA